MTPHDAAKLLEVPADTPPEQLEKHFLELRRRLEDKIAKAPTPGLQAKYRTTLQEITEAFETLVLAADASSLPVLQKTQPIAPAATRPESHTTSHAPIAPLTASAPAAPRRKSGGMEFALVVVVALVLLGGGGWWVVRQRAEKAEQARQAAAAEELARQQKLAAEAEQARLSQLATQLRTRLAEARIAMDAYESEVRESERRANEAKSEYRGARDASATQKAMLSAQAMAHDLFTNWLKGFLLRHPAKLARARAEQLLDARSIEDAAKAVEEMNEAMAPMDEAIDHHRRYYLQDTAEALIESKPAGLAFVLTDTYGRTTKGTTPAVLTNLPLTHVADASDAKVKLGDATTGTNQVRISRTGWEDRIVERTASEAGPIKFEAEFPEGSVAVRSLPSGVPFKITQSRGWSASGTTPATVTGVPVGTVTVRLTRQGYADVTQNLEVNAGKTASTELDQRSQVVRIEIADGGKIFVDGKLAGTHKAEVSNLTPGEHTLQLESPGYSQAYRTKFTVKQQTAPASLTYSFKALSTKNITCQKCSGAGKFHREQLCETCRGTQIMRCDYCEGRGYVGGINGFSTSTCASCWGKGRKKCDEGRCENGYWRWDETCTTCWGDGRVSALQLSQ